MQQLREPPWRTLLLLLAILAAAGVLYLGWGPGVRLQDGRHDRRTNGIWLQHGWLGDDGWFVRNGRARAKFRDPRRIRDLANLLASHGVEYVFPHLCPCTPDGRIAPVDDAQTELFLDHFAGFQVVPWIGGVLGTHCRPESEPWRRAFIQSVVDLLGTHPRLAGVQLNIEPLPTGDEAFLVLLAELRAALPEGRILSVAAYPPPTRWHPFVEVHWDEEYTRRVAQQTDLFVPMMYDTAIRWGKPYQRLMARWTQETLRWTGSTKVLLGVPAYGDAGVGYHDPDVENLRNAIRGIHAGLKQFPSLPDGYLGVSIYCEWEMDDEKWDEFRREFGRVP